MVVINTEAKIPRIKILAEHAETFHSFGHLSICLDEMFTSYFTDFKSKR